VTSTDFLAKRNFKSLFFSLIIAYIEILHFIVLLSRLRVELNLNYTARTSQKYQLFFCMVNLKIGSATNKK
jgi:hypothetical protein